MHPSVTKIKITLDVGYRTGWPQTARRCDNCVHMDPNVRVKQHGRRCALHGAAVKTHGCCRYHEAPPREAA